MGLGFLDGVFFFLPCHLQIYLAGRFEHAGDIAYPGGRVSRTVVVTLGMHDHVWWFVFVLGIRCTVISWTVSGV